MHVLYMHVFSIALDFTSTLFCMQQIIIVFWTVLGLIFTFFYVQVIHMLF